MSLILSRQALLLSGSCRSSTAHLALSQDRSVVTSRCQLAQALTSSTGYQRRCMSANGPSGSRVKVSVSRDDIRIAAPNVDLESLPEYLKKECLLFYYPEQEALAKKVAQASSSIQLGEVKWA